MRSKSLRVDVVGCRSPLLATACRADSCSLYPRDRAALPRTQRLGFNEDLRVGAAMRILAEKYNKQHSGLGVLYPGGYGNACRARDRRLRSLWRRPSSGNRDGGTFDRADQLWVVARTDSRPDQVRQWRAGRQEGSRRVRRARWA